MWTDPKNGEALKMWTDPKNVELGIAEIYILWVEFDET